MASKKSTKANSDMQMKIAVIIALLIAFVGGYLIARAKYKPQIIELAKMVTDKDTALSQMKSNANKVMMEGDKMFVVENGMVKPMDSDIMMTNGDKVSTSGEITKSDGSTDMMHNGDSMDMNGKMLQDTQDQSQGGMMGY
jgi:hypothetical protein